MNAIMTEGVRTTLLVLSWVLIISFLAGIGWWIWIISTYKIKFRIRKVTGSNNIIFDDQAKVVRVGKSGKSVVKWRLRRQKENIPVPPDDAISIDKKGKMVVEAYYTSQGQYTYIKPNKKIESLDPLTTEDKSFYGNEYRDSLKYKGVDWSGAIPIIASGVVLITVLVLAMIFVSNIVEPANMVADKLALAIESAKGCITTPPPVAP